MNRVTAAFFVAAPTTFAGTSIGVPNGMIFCFAGIVVAWSLLLVGILAAERARRNGCFRALVFATAASIGLVASVVVYAWPLRAAYAFSQPALDRIAENVRAGRPPNGPVWAGVFRVEQAQIDYNGVPCLWVNTNSAGRTGFAMCGPINPPFNIQTHVSLDERWQYVVED